MALKQTLERVRTMFEGTSLDSRFPPRYPPAAVEFSPRGVTGVRVARERRGGRPAILAAAWREFPAGALVASLNRANIVDPAAVGAALEGVLAEVAPGEHRVSLLLPDNAARVALLNFTTLPATRRELAGMVRFRMAKSLPFKADDAVMDLMLLNPTGAASVGAVLALFMHRPILEQYESLLAERGYWPGFVGLATFELYNLFRGRLDPGAADRDLLMLNMTRQYLTLVIVSGGTIIFYRCRPHAGSGDDPGFAAVRREIYTSLAFYQEKLLGRGIGRVWLRATGVPVDEAAEAVREEAGCPVDVLRLAESLPAGEGVALDEEALARVAPAAGAIVGRRA
jgi:hypothetical protein